MAVDFTTYLYPQSADYTGGQTIGQHAFERVLGGLSAFQRVDFEPENIAQTQAIVAELETQLNASYVASAPYFPQPLVPTDTGVDIRTMLAINYAGCFARFDIFGDAAKVAQNAIAYADAYITNAP
jgi:hypothetical protein